ncbi:zinc finger protein 597 isoform X2 [Castor canadensis]|uniref:Zinc finger protein 597 isoform X2 n=1 Tax=Castor canadensis TaxID=51338 RepID=A0AC58LEE3_CASCN
MASTRPTPDAQGPTLFEDLAVYFSQEECVSLQPDPQERSEDGALIGRKVSLPGIRYKVPALFWESSNRRPPTSQSWLHSSSPRPGTSGCTGSDCPAWCGSRRPEPGQER